MKKQYLSLQGEELNRCGELYIEKYPKLKVKLVDGSSLAAAIILNNIPKETTQVLFKGNITKVAKAVASALGEKGVQVIDIWLYISIYI